MKILHLFFRALLLLCIPCACGKDLPEPSAQTAERTVIVYMMAENSLNSFSDNDLYEIKQVYGTIPANTNLVVYIDDNTLPRIYNVTAKKGFAEWKTFKEDHLSTDSLTMLQNLREITTKFPAKKYGLVMWSHGSGWVPQSRSIGIDNGTNSSSNSGLQMNINTLRCVLEQLPHFEYILFDACAMQSVEVAYELRNVTDYIIGSPTEIHAEGAPYDKILPAMMTGNVKEIVELYYQTYETWGGVIISLIECKELEQFAQSTANVLGQCYEQFRQTDADNIQIYYPYSSSSGWIPEPYDIEGLMHHTLDSASFAGWKKSLDKVVLYKNATRSWTTVFPGYNHCHLLDSEHYTAVSIFLPQEKYARQGWNEKLRSLQWYKAAGWDQLGW